MQTLVLHEHLYNGMLNSTSSLSERLTGLHGHAWTGKCSEYWRDYVEILVGKLLQLYRNPSSDDLILIIAPYMVCMMVLESDCESRD